MNDTAKIPIPTRLTRPRAAVRAARVAAVGLRASEDGRLVIGPRRGVLHLAVSRPLLRRALLIAEAVFGEAERRGWSVEPFDGRSHGSGPGVAVVIRGHAYPVEVHEETETIPFSNEELAAWRRQSKWVTDGRPTPPPQRKRKRATGTLRLSLPNGYGGGRANWSDGPRGPIDDKLLSVFETLEARAEEDDRRAKRAACLAEERRREEIAREANARRVRIEEARVERLLAEIKFSKQARDVREYVEQLRARLPDAADDDARSRISRWCDWAIGWANWADPVTNPERVHGLDDASDQYHYPPRR